MRKSYQFRIYPTKKQEVKLIRTLDTCRHLYNNALAERKRQSDLNAIYKKLDVFPWGKPEWIDYYDQQNALPRNKTIFQEEVHSHVLQNVLRRVEKTFANFFNGFGYPRFKGRNRYDSFTYPDSNGGYKIKDGKVILSKIGSIKIKQHRKIEGTIKTCTIKKDIDQWYAIFSTDNQKTIVPVGIKTSTGIDVGLSSLLTLSNGNTIEPPKFLRCSEKKLAREQIKLSRKKKRSNNRKNQVKIVARLHRTIRNQRKDFAHKTSRALVDTYDKIVFEDLQIKNMMQNHHFAKSISDASWYQLINLTKSKAEYAGKIVELVNPRGTSQTCICGNHVPKTLSMRSHNCDNCGISIGRDHMSANVIESRSITAGTAGFQTCLSNLNRDPMKREAPSERAG
ncbi:MAG: transposase [Candidatus Methanoperedens sp.]